MVRSELAGRRLCRGGTTAMYFSTVLAARVAGRRTFAQLSVFDVIVTVAVGSLLASTSARGDPSYGQGMAALLMLLVLQVLVAAARRRFSAVTRLLEFEPEVVLRDGDVQLGKSVLGPQLTWGELESALRQHRVLEVPAASVVLLGPTGQFSVGRSSK